MPFAAPRRSADQSFAGVGLSELLRDLPWDSAFFGLRIASVLPRRLSASELTQIEERRRRENLDCVYFLADPTDAAGLERVSSAGWRFVDVRVTLDRSLDAGPDGSKHSDSVRHAEVADLPSLRKLARESHADSRFYQDGRFSRTACDRLFEEWIAKSVAGELADAVLVSGPSGAPLGYVTLRSAGQAAASIGLFAVAPSARGRGLGSGLLAAGLAWARARGCSAISVVTQGSNVGAQRVYQRAGFTTREAAYWYHAWR